MTFLSVTTFLKARFRRADGPDGPRYSQGGLFTAGSAHAREEALASSRLSKGLVSFLLDMDNKLDAIISRLELSNLSEDFPHEARVIELGGSDLVLETGQPLALGEHLEVIITLESFPVNVVSALVRVEAETGLPPASGKSNKAYKLSFVNLLEEEQDRIISFAFQEERRRIRAYKNED